MRDYQSKKIKNHRIRKELKRKKGDYFKIFLGFLKIILWLSLTSAFFIGIAIFWNFLLRSPYLLVKEVKVKGGQKVSANEVLRLSKINPGSDILTLNLKEISAKIKKNPWIDEVRVSRRFPNQIEIEIKERKPLALINLDTLYLVDSKGIIFKKLEIEEKLDFPVLTGLSWEDLKNNPNLSSYLINKAIYLLNLSKKDNRILSWEEISEINLNQTLGLSIFTLGGTQIKIGSDNFKEKLVQLEKVQKDVEKRFKKAESIDLNYKGRVFVKLGKSA